jgi:DNA-binding LacI/PurR family transcriptional regulator
MIVARRRKSMRRRVSEEQVARRAGVSRTTVSFVLNNAPGKHISEQTRQKVLRTAAELGYQRTSPPRQPVAQYRPAVALLVCRTQFFFSDAFVTRIIQGMSQVLNKRRCRLIVRNAGPNEQDYVGILRQLGAEGAVLVNTRQRDTGLGKLVSSKLPLVAIGGLVDSRIPQVTVDNTAAAGQLTEYLIGLGHTSIAMILHAPLVYHFARERLAGYRQALRAAGLPYRPALVRVADFSVESGYRQMQSLLRLTPPPTAVFGSSDSVAAGALRAIHDAGLQVPESVSVAGFEDDLVSRYLFPPLTSLSLPAEGMGATAAGMVLELMDGGRRAPRHAVLPTSLSIRMSCGMAPAGRSDVKGARRAGRGG